MATTIDNKVVEMKFDNKNFEKNTKQSMATLDKLKSSLDMAESEKSLKALDRASKETNFKEMSDGAESLSVKFSAMSAIAVTAISKITSKLMDMGEQMLRSMSGIDQAMAGFSKYEDNIGYQQTMLNNAAGLTEEEMKKLLDKLTWFSNETSFSASDMMGAMSKYIANGADPLVAQATAVGTALWTALSGNSGESLAMANYNLPQIFGSGYMRLQDWKSIINAKMDTPWVREIFIKTGEELGTLKKKADGVWEAVGTGVEVTMGNFTGSMTEGAWFTTDVLTTALGKFSKFTDEVYDEVERTGELTFDVIERLGTDVTDLGVKSLRAAQETKTWSETWAYTQEAIASGWSETFETIFGSYGESKKFFSEMVESLYTLFVETGDVRNEFLSGWADFIPDKTPEQRIDAVTRSEEEFSNITKDAAINAKAYKQILNEVARGQYTFKSGLVYENLGKETASELEKIYNDVFAKDKNGEYILDAVNRYSALNSSVLALVDKEFKKSGKRFSVGPIVELEEEEPLTAREDFLTAVNSFLASIAEAKSKISSVIESAFGMTPQLFYEKVTHPIAEFLRSFEDRVENFDPSFLVPLLGSAKQLLDIVKNLLAPVGQIFYAIKDGAIKTFIGESTTLKGTLNTVQTALSKIQKLTAKFKIDSYWIQSLSNIVKGLLSPIKIVWKIIKAIGEAIGDIVKSNLKSESTGLIGIIVGFAEGIASVISSFDAWLEKTGAVKKFIVPAMKFISKVIGDVWSALKRFFNIDDDIKEAGFWQNGLPDFEHIFAKWTNAKKWINEHITQPINDAFGINLHIPSWDEIFAGWEKFKSFIKEKVVKPFEEITGIKLHWPTWDDLKKRWGQFKDWFRENITEPFEEASGIKLRWPTLDDMKAFFQKIKDFFAGMGKDTKNEEKVAANLQGKKKIWSTLGIVIGEVFNLVKMVFGYIGEFVGYLLGNKNLMSAVEGGVIAYLVKALLDFLSDWKEVLGNFGEFSESLNGMMKSVSKNQNSKATKNLATSLLMIAFSLLILASIPMDKVSKALAVVVELMGMLVATMAATKPGELKKGQVQAKSNSSILLKMAASIFIIALALKSLTNIDDVAKMNAAAMIVESLFAVVAMFAIIMQKSTKTVARGEKASSVSIQFLSIAILILALASAIKKLSKIPNFSIESPAYLAIRNLLILVESMIIAVAAVTSKTSGKKGNGTAMVLAIYGIIDLIVFLVVAMAVIAKDFSAQDVSEFIAMTDGITTIVAVLAGLTLAIGIAVALANKNAKAKSAQTISNFVAILLVVGVLALGIANIISKIANATNPNSFLTAALAIVFILSAVALIAMVLSNFQSKASAGSIATSVVMFKLLASVVSKIAKSLSELVGFLNITERFGKVSKKSSSSNLMDAALAITLILAAMATIVAAMSQLKSTKGLLAAAIAMTIMGQVIGKIAVGISSIVAATSIFTKSSGILESALAIVLVLAAIGTIVAAMSQIKSTKGILVAAVSMTIMAAVISKIAAGIAGIVAATAIFKQSSDIVESAFSIVLVMTVMGMILAAMSNIQTGKAIAGVLASSVALAIMSVAIVKIATSISTIVAVTSRFKSGATLMDAALAISVLLGALSLIIWAITGLPSASGLAMASIFMVAAGAAILAIAGGLASLAKVASVGTTSAIWVATAAIAGLLVVLTAVAVIASNPKFAFGFVTMGNSLWAFGKILAYMAVALLAVVAAISMFKNSIAIIGEKAEEIKTGVIVIFEAIALGLAKFVETIMPTILKVVGDLIMWILKSVPEWLKALLPLVTTFVEFILTLIVEVLDRLATYIGPIIAMVMKLVFALLEALGEWIGPLVVKLLDFIVEVIEGLAFAIASRGGKILAAIYDALAAIIGLVNTAISTLINAILTAIGFGWLGDIVEKLFGGISNTVAGALTKAGDDAIKQSDTLTDKLVSSNKRMAAQYEKSAKKTQASMQKSNATIASGLPSSGESSNGLGLGGITSGLTSNLGTSQMNSMGVASGLSFGEGFDAGLGEAEIDYNIGMPTVEDYYNDGYDKAVAEQDGWTTALIEGIKSGRIRTLNDVSKWVEKNGVTDNEFIDEVIDLYKQGKIQNVQQIQQLYDDKLAAEAAKTAAKDSETAFNTSFNNLKDKIADNRGDDVGTILGYNKGDIDVIMNDLSNLMSATNGFQNIEDGTRNNLLAIAKILDSYGQKELSDIAKTIRDIIESPNDVDYTEANNKLSEWVQKREDAYQAEKRREDWIRINTDKAEQREKDRQERAAARAEEEAKRREEEAKEQAEFEEKKQKAMHDANVTRDMATKAPLIANGQQSANMFIDGYMHEFDKLSPAIQQKMRDMASGAIPERRNMKGNLMDLTFEQEAIYNVMKEYWNDASNYWKDEAIRQGAISDAFSAFLGFDPNSDAKQDFRDMILDLATSVPGLLEPLKDSLDETSRRILEETDWTAIIANPDSIDKDAFKLLFSNLYLLGQEAASNYAAGLINGINNKAPEIEPAASRMAAGMVKITKSVLQIKSPSRVGKDIGENFVLGVAEGVEDTTDEAGLASEETAISMWQRLKDAINAAVGFNLDELNPVIRPILDLDEILSGADQINNLIGGSKVFERRGSGLGVGPVGDGARGFRIGYSTIADLQAIAQMNKTGLAQAIQESVLTQPVNQTLNNTFNIQSNDPNEVARRVSAILSNQVQRKQQVWGPAKVNRATQ